MSSPASANGVVQVAPDVMDSLSEKIDEQVEAKNNAAAKTKASKQHKPKVVGSKLTMSPHLMASTTRSILEGYELVVRDMAGTTVEEGGMVYETLREVMIADGLTVTEDDMHAWHGAKKEAVLEHFAR